MIIYVGEAEDVIKRILTNHCRGNVEASTFRRSVAEAMGYIIKSEKRSSGSVRVRLYLPDPLVGEKEVSNYIRSGNWRYVICNYNEVKDFQWYAIDQLKPLLNKDCKQWNNENLQRYQSLLDELTNSSARNCDQLRGIQSGPGVYVFHNHRRPSQKNISF